MNTTAQGVLLALAQHLRPAASAELHPDADRDALVVSYEPTGRLITIEAIATVNTIVSRAYYCNTSTWRVYGPIGEPEAAASAILSELART